MTFNFFKISPHTNRIAAQGKPEFCEIRRCARGRQETGANKQKQIIANSSAAGLPRGRLNGGSLFARSLFDR
jgi:hypothetical protein